MIIRKPYAFLIKYFKIIHITLFVFMTYLMFKFQNIYSFFREFLKTGTYFYTNDLTTHYISVPMIISTILLIGILLLIFFLMRQKKKPVFYYLSAIIFYFISFVGLIFLITIFKNLEFHTYSNQVLVLLRDFTMVLYYLSYYFLVISFIRGFGFNIKKFNFEKDIKELDISDEDREEIEVKAIIDYENVSNFLRRRKRNFKYYFKENSYILIVFLVIISLSLTAYFTIDNLVINKVYKENQTILVNDIEYTIKNSYFTNLDKNGSLIKEGKYYLIVDFNVLNKQNKDLKLNIDKTRLNINNNYYYPNLKLSKEFSDLGIIYKNQVLKTLDEYNYLIVFEFDNDTFDSKAILEIYYANKIINNESVSYYKGVKLNPVKFLEKEIGKYKLNQVVSLSDTYIKEGNFNISNYSLHDTLEYKYTRCENENGECLEYTKTIASSFNKVILKIDYSLDIDTIRIFDYLNIQYKINDKSYYISSDLINDITPDNYLENSILLEVDKNIKDKELNLIFDVRGTKFTIGDSYE